jgi:hypothetical protein
MRLGVGVLLVLLAVQTRAWAILPSVSFNELAAESQCVLIGDFSSESKLTNSEGLGVFAFQTLAVVGGQHCDGRLSRVVRLSDESPADVKPGQYVLFLKRRDADSFLYAHEPFSILAIRKGMVRTLPFADLAEWTPLESLLVIIGHARSKRH